MQVKDVEENSDTPEMLIEKTKNAEGKPRKNETRDVVPEENA